MIQILGLRSFVGKEGNTVTYDKLFDTGIEAETLQEIFEKHAEIVEKIPPNERWNIFYTIANCGEKKREFKSLSTIVFDLDKINHQYEDSYIEVVCSALGVSRSDIGIVSSGNGYHFLLGLAETITDKDFFKQNKPHYNAVCRKIKLALDNAGLPGEVDTVVFEPRRILRMPGTVNRKPDKPEKNCVLLNPIRKPVAFRLDAISDVPQVKSSEQVDKATLRKYPASDPAAVLTGCNFLKHCHDSPNAIDEPTWYAALSITARLDGQGSTGEERSHQLSQGHQGYSREATDLKITQALEASGPRTCEGINGLWGKCGDCKHWGTKITTPLHIVSDGTISTEGSGFYTVIVDKKKGTTKYLPNYEDLIAYFKREHDFKVLGDTRLVYVWKGTHYAPIEKASLEAFARDKFKPTPEMKVCNEWRDRVRIANIVPLEWWDSTPNRKMNFLNGYLDVDTMEFRPHDAAIAFRHVLPYDYDPAARAPAFEKMLHLVTGGDPDTIKVLEEFLGYCLSNDTCWAQKALVLTGEGSNGKSTFVDTLKMLAGRKNFSSISMDKIDDQYSLATLDGKLFNIAEETSQKAFKNNSTFKNLATGGSFMVRMIYKEPYELTNRAKLILTCNALPDSTDQTYGFYRRLLIIPFSQVIEKTNKDYDPYMIDKLRAELSGIFNLAMLGYKRLVAQRGFTESERLKESLEEYRLENDTVLSWVMEHLVVHQNGGFADHFTPVGDLYAAYRDAMKATGRQAENAQKFCKQLGKLRPEIWGEHPYKERSTRRRVEVQGRVVQVRGLQGVQIEPIN